MTKKLLSALVIAGLLAAVPAAAQQAGRISGRITSADGEPLPGVTVEARGDVLPQARVAISSEDGRYVLPQLPPGRYDVTYTLDGMAVVTQRLTVLLQQTSIVDITLRPAGFEEEIRVLGDAPVVDRSSSELKTAISNESLSKLPAAQEYRDIIKLIPGVQYSEEEIRGPSAGGNGQDNVYLFDGVDVGLPLFGTLSSESSSHDVDQVAIVKGGAKALDFNRSGGFTVNTVSKSGTNEYHGSVSYQLQSKDLTSDRDVETATEFEEDKDWTVLNFGGPLVSENLFFYASYFSPTRDRANRSNLYGEVPDLDETRDELFGKLTWSPTDSVLLHGSYRDSDRETRGDSVLDSDNAGSTSSGVDRQIEIAIAEGTWVSSSKSFLSFRLTDYAHDSLGRPDTIFDFPIAIDGSAGLDVNNLDQMGHFFVPTPVAGENSYNAFIAPLIERYGYLSDGVRTGGGDLGGHQQFDGLNYFRESYQAGFDYSLGGAVSHDLHIGYRWSSSGEDLQRTSNGWGNITVPGGRACIPADGSVPSTLPNCSNEPGGTPVFYEGRIHQMTLGGAVVDSIHSEFESQDIELNDTIRWNDWTFNAGVLLSNDTYFGQGLRPNSSNISGFELAPGHDYEMYDIDFDDMIQPRLGAVWAYNGSDTVYANYARYNPAASSLPRAASWDRNLAAEINVYFDAEGNFLGSAPLASSSGKFFDEGLEPRSIDEYLIGTAQQLNSRWTGRAYARYRKGAHFWEDTNNTARVDFEPPAGIPREPYIPNLDDVRGEIGGSSYVIAELDDGFTKYYEVGIESDWRGDKAYLQGSLVWSHYYGNFDQDNTTTDNDDDIFIGSSFIADAAGRQVWDFKYGDLRGDRRYQLKLFGSYELPWNASAGAYAIYQDGQPWEAWDVETYRCLLPLGPELEGCEVPGTTSTSSASRFAEPAGSRRSDDHYQLDLNYTQNFLFGGRYNVQLAADLFNVFDKQTGYDIDPFVSDSTFGEARNNFLPRRLQLAVRFQF